MNGKLEDAKNIAKRIIGNNNTNGSGNGEAVNSGANSTGTGGGGASTSMDTSISQDNSDYELWLEQASAKIEQLSKSGFNYEQILIKFLSMLQLPNSPISQPNWAICNNEGQTLLHLACLKNYYKLSLFLLHRGSKVNFHDVNNLSPLHYSLINGNRDLFKLLIKYKANLSVKIKNGVTIRDLADSNILDLINEYGNEEDGSLDSHAIKDGNGNGSTVIKSDKGKETIDDFGRRRLSNDSLSSFASSFDSKGVEESLELDLDLIKPTFKSFNKTGVVKSDFFEDDYSDFADDEQQWGDGNYDCDNDDEYSIGRNDIGELKSIKSLDENSSLYVNDTNNIVAIPAVETEKSVDDEEDDDNDVIASDKLDTLDLEIKKIDSVAKSELDNDDTSSISKSKGKKNMVTFADSDDVENQKDSDGNDADDDRKDQVDDATILAKSTIFDTNKLIGRSLWGKMKKAFRYTPILNKSSLSGLSSNEDNQTDFGEITENNDNATIVDGNESSNESR
ncbi:unnamed protein product [[Candida] boidinii]|nr:unnamed protein product [[Candida] boidinii]